MHYTDVNQSKVGMAMLILDKVGIRAKKINRDTEEPYSMITGPICQ
jgi:hypothetical protein